MSTKTMRFPPRRISTSSNNNAPTTTKRKERKSALDAPQAPKSHKLSLEPPASALTSSGQLLSGYLVTSCSPRGLPLGQRWDPIARSAKEGSPVDHRLGEAEPPQYEKLERYVEAAYLLTTGGAQLAGIVYPTQLARLLQL